METREIIKLFFGVYFIYQFTKEQSFKTNVCCFKVWWK